MSACMVLRVEWLPTLCSFQLAFGTRVTKVTFDCSELYQDRASCGFWYKAYKGYKGKKASVKTFDC
eukprot:459947-Pelagomonas_calceolata.AAC.1